MQLEANLIITVDQPKNNTFMNKNILRSEHGIKFNMEGYIKYEMFKCLSRIWRYDKNNFNGFEFIVSTSICWLAIYIPFLVLCERLMEK